MASTLKIERIKRDLTQLELAKLANVSNWKLCLVENGYKTLNPDEAKRVSRILGVSERKLYAK